jgi:hypothetical protein
MKKLIVVFFVLFTFMSFAQKKDKRNLVSFNKLEVFGNIEVEMILSDIESIDIFTTNVDPSEVETIVKDKLLKIKMKSNLFDDDVKVKIILRYKEITDISSNAAADINVKDLIKGEKLFLTATSGGRIKLKVELKTINIKSYQGAHIDISGTVGLQESFVNTGGVLSGSDFSSDEVLIKMNTGGKAEIVVNKSLDANVNTGASLNYFGTPATENIKTTLGGKINAWDKKE